MLWCFVAKFPEVAQFEREIKAFAEKRLPEEVVKLQRMVSLELLTRVVDRSPVDTGRLRASWQLSINRTSRRVAPYKRAKDTAQQVIDRGKAAISSLPPFSAVYLSNNIEYLEVIEFGRFDPPNPGPSKDKRPDREGQILVSGGFSTQSPHGMVRISVAEVLQIVR